MGMKAGVSVLIGLYVYGALRGLRTSPTRRSSDLEARPREDGLGDHRAAQHLARLEPGERHDRDRRVAKRVLADHRSEEHTSELQSRLHLVCSLLPEQKKRDRTASASITQLPSSAS